VEENGKAEIAAQFVGSSNCEAVGTSDKERGVVEVVGVEEQVAQSGAVSARVKDKC